MLTGSVDGLFVIEREITGVAGNAIGFNIRGSNIRESILGTRIQST
jgi:hypothetical protein